MGNSWPGGVRRAMSQTAHADWNAGNYPGTRQLCARCDCPTGRCEEDTLCLADDDPLCEKCYNKEMAERDGLPKATSPELCEVTDE